MKEITSIDINERIRRIDKNVFIRNEQQNELGIAIDQNVAQV